MRRARVRVTLAPRARGRRFRARLRQAFRPAWAGPVPERRPDGAERGASSAPWAWPTSRAPEARWLRPGGQPRPAELPLAAEPQSATEPRPAEPERRSQRHDPACDLG